MKKLLLLSVFLLIGFYSYSQIVNIPDANFKNALVNEIVADFDGDGVFDGDVDTNNDGEIQVVEAEDVLGLNVPNYDIESLVGIESFINLSFLRCVNNLLNELDVSTLIHLEKLFCYFNNINDINVNGLTQLTFLWVAWNQLESIDISSLQNLEKINCGYNQLNALDVSGLYNLESILAGNNNISSIDLSDNALLRSVELSDNLLTSINVNFLQNLEGLGVVNNFLTEIDVSNMSSLSGIYVGSNDITELDCSTTGAFYIHCENNPNLTSINVQNGVISYSDPDLLNWGFYFYDLPSLEFICMDPGEWQALSVSGYDPANVVVATGPDCTLTIDDFADSNFVIYPNPVQDVLRIDNTSHVEITSIKIYDVLGRLVLVEKGNVNRIYLSHLNTGVLFLEIETVQGIITKKIIKE
jgi:Secretion system C-terminal sorting domain